MPLLDSFLCNRHRPDVPQEDCPDHVALVKDKTVVAPLGFLLQDLLSGVSGRDLADAEHVQAQHLERVAARQTGELRGGSGEVSPGDRSLSLGGGPESVDQAFMLSHVAGGQDIGM